MTTPTQAQIDAASKAARDELTAISGYFINYNSQISDEQMQTFITKVLTAALSVPAAKPPAKTAMKPVAKKGKRK
jgi:hypothetical protein